MNRSAPLYSTFSDTIGIKKNLSHFPSLKMWRQLISAKQTASPLFLCHYWCLVLKLGSVVHSPLLVPPPGLDTPLKSVSCLKIMKVHFAGCLRLICTAVVGLRASP